MITISSGQESVTITASSDTATIINVEPTLPSRAEVEASYYPNITLIDVTNLNLNGGIIV